MSLNGQGTLTPLPHIEGVVLNKGKGYGGPLVPSWIIKGLVPNRIYKYLPIRIVCFTMALFSE